jgi:TonB family protein
MIAEDRPPSLLQRRPLEGGTWVLGLLTTLSAHLLIPALVLGSQWLILALGLAVPVAERERPHTVDVVAAEFVRLGKPFDPRRLPSRKVPPVAKRKPDGVVVSKDAREAPEKKPEEKEKPRDAKASLLDNLVDRTRDFAEDVEYEQEGDPNGIREGTASTAKEGNIYAGKLRIFFHRNWTVPNVVQNPESRVVVVQIETSDDGRLTSVELESGSGDAYFDQSALDAVDALIQSGATLPDPPDDLREIYFGTSFNVRFSGKDLR